MKKQLLTILAFLAVSFCAMADNISIADVSLTRDIAKSVDICLANTATNIVGFQFDLTLPAGVTPATSSTGAVTTTATNRLGTSYTLRGKLQDGTTYRFVYLSTSGTGISGTSGSLFSINLTASSTAACGENTATISNVTLTGKDATEQTPSDVTFNITSPHELTATAATAATCTTKGNNAYWHCSICNKYFSDATATTETTLAATTIAALGHNLSSTDNGDGTHTTKCSRCDYSVTESHTFVNGVCSVCGSIEKTEEADTDISTIANTVYIENTETTKGSQLTLSLKMKNTVSAQGFQCDVYLPEGATFATDEDGFYQAALNTARTTATKTNYFDCALQSDGALRILCNSTKGYTFSGNDGEVATIVVNISNDMNEGEYPIIIKEIEISDKESNSYTQSYIKSTLTISSYTLGDANNDGKITVTDFTAVANAILGNAPATYVAKAADVNIDNKVTVSDLTGIANIILYGSVTGASNAKAVSISEYVAPTVYIPAFSVQQGSTVKVPVYISNASTGFSAYQMDINLPEGLKVEDACITDDRVTDHVLQSAQMADGAYRLLSYSTKNNNFSGDNGAVAILTISANNIACGTYTGEAKNIELSENAKAYNAKTATLNITVDDATGVNRISVSDVNGKDAIYDISGRRMNTIQKGVNIINGKKQVIK